MLVTCWSHADHPQLKPVDFVDDAPLHTKENMFMAGVDHIKSVSENFTCVSGGSKRGVLVKTLGS